MVLLRYFLKNVFLGVLVKTLGRFFPLLLRFFRLIFR